MEIAQIYGNLPIIETERLLLRKITFDDANDLFEYTSDQMVSEFVTWDHHETILDTKGFIHFVNQQYALKKVAPWGIEYKENNKMIGTIDFVSWQPKHHNAEIGYAVAQPYWGQGITTEAAKALINFGFTKMDLVRIQARCMIGNIGSQRVMEKCGMTFEGIIRKGIFAKGKHHDLKLYSILREEFELHTQG
ncbi:GNAT family N-acetyltransferase [Bacillus sp. AGMB 02131]|uniref:GNAT family N-acetyltransferase n=1 Tax=Peribacillus faecalis TaxID=2772559 RepID=A0A927H8R7_9BACI|nr:GNAT family protein [Peribacillus faecalis]MBD3106790.1 GNAT family N-acetyltransferase [Peribacillus faecalis]